MVVGRRWQGSLLPPAITRQEMKEKEKFQEALISILMILSCGNYQHNINYYFVCINITVIVNAGNRQHPYAEY